MKNKPIVNKEHETDLKPLDIGVAIAVVCVLAYLAYSGLKKIGTIEAKLPDELAYGSTEFTKQSVSDIVDMLSN